MRVRREKAVGQAENMTLGVKIRHVLMKVLLSATVFVFAGAIAFLTLQISGKNRLYGSADSGELIATLTEIAQGAGVQETDEDWQYGDIRHEGVHYRYNEDILTFLFLGIDKMGEVKETKEAAAGGQSDAVFLLILNPHEKKISVIGIPRDTMTEIEVYDTNGMYAGTVKAQIAVQHGYGDGAGLSCERTVRAVSRLFYGLPVHGYCAVNMGAIPLINDAVGGIELTALETLDFEDFKIKEGETVLLEGMDAYYYLHNRDITGFNSAGGRLQRQKQYLTLYAAAAIEAVKKDITFPVTLYNTLKKYTVTDLTVDEISYLATQAAGYGFDGEDMYVLRGATFRGEEHEEFRVDENALYELILKVFYEEVK